MAFADWVQHGHTAFDRGEDRTVYTRRYRVAEAVAESELPARGEAPPWVDDETPGPDAERVLRASGRMARDSYEVEIVTYKLAGSLDGAGALLTLPEPAGDGEDPDVETIDRRRFTVRVAAVTESALPAKGSEWADDPMPTGFRAVMVERRLDRRSAPGVTVATCVYVGFDGTLDDAESPTIMTLPEDSTGDTEPDEDDVERRTVAVRVAVVDEANLPALLSTWSGDAAFGGLAAKLVRRRLDRRAWPGRTIATLIYAGPRGTLAGGAVTLYGVDEVQTPEGTVTVERLAVADEANLPAFGAARTGDATAEPFRASLTRRRLDRRSLPGYTVGQCEYRSVRGGSS